MNKGIYRIAAGVGAAVILVSSATAQAATVTANGTPAPVASDSIAGWPAAPAVTSETAVLKMCIRDRVQRSGWRLQPEGQRNV